MQFDNLRRVSEFHAVGLAQIQASRKEIKNRIAGLRSAKESDDCAPGIWGCIFQNYPRGGFHQREQRGMMIHIAVQHNGTDGLLKLSHTGLDLLPKQRIEFFKRRTDAAENRTR